MGADFPIVIYEHLRAKMVWAKRVELQVQIVVLSPVPLHLVQTSLSPLL